MAKAPKSAMVFAAGLGTRMRPLTDTVPKPLIKVGGTALIDHCLDLLERAGIERAIVNVHYLADRIEKHLRGRQRPEIAISDERALLLDQGGGIKKALPELGDEPFLVCNTDAFWIEGPCRNLDRLFAAFDAGRMDAILLVASSAASIGVDWPGDFTMDADGRLHKRLAHEVAPFVYTGVAILKPEPFRAAAQDVFRLAPFLFDWAAKGRLFGVRLDGLWLYVGRPETIAEAERALARSKI